MSLKDIEPNYGMTKEGLKQVENDTHQNKEAKTPLEVSFNNIEVKNTQVDEYEYEYEEESVHKDANSVPLN